MVAERLTERPPDTADQFVERGRRLSVLDGLNEVGPHNPKRYDSTSTAGTALSVRLIDEMRLVWAGPLPDRRSRLIDQHLRRHVHRTSSHLRFLSVLRTAGDGPFVRAHLQ